MNAAKKNEVYFSISRYIFPCDINDPGVLTVYEFIGGLSTALQTGETRTRR